MANKAAEAANDHASSTSSDPREEESKQIIN